MHRSYHGWTMVWALAATVTVGYGVVYAFGVFLRPMEAEFGWSRAQSSAQLTVAYLTAGLAAPLVGRVVDRHGARLVMTTGSVLFAIVLTLQAHVASYEAYLAIGVGLGVAMAATLYDVAFTVAAVWFRRDRARAVFAITAVGALASTVFVPLATALEVWVGWRGALLVFAALIAVAVAPTHALVLRRRPSDLGLLPDGVGPDDDAPTAASPERSVSPRAALASAAFWSVGVGFTLAKLASGALSLHLVPLLGERGLTAALVAAAAGAVGVVQLAGRAAFPPLARRLSLTRLTALTFSAHAVGIGVLLLGDGLGAVWTFVLLYGATNGAMTIARATLTADLFGPDHYGAVSGLLAVPITLGMAIAPAAAGAARTAWGGYDGVLLVLTACTACGTLAVLRARPTPGPSSSRRHARG